MSSNYWIKLYLEILNDPKMARLSDRLFRRTIELFLLAGTLGMDGLLPPVQDMSWQLRVTPQKLMADLEALREIDILDYADGCWNVVNFRARQAPADTNERVKRHRDTKKQNQFIQVSNGDVTKRYISTGKDGNESETKRYTDTDTETEADADTKEEENAVGVVFKSYENEIGMITAIIAEEIKSAIEQYPLEWFERAFQEAARQNKRSWKYALAILKRWKVEGVGGTKPVNGSYEAWQKMRLG